MIHSLVLRLVAARGADEQLDTALLQWAEEAIGFTDAEYLRHCCGLTGDMEKAARFAAWALPGVRFTFTWIPAERFASATAHVGDDPKPMPARDLANAFLAATIASHPAFVGERSRPSATETIALQRLA